MQEGFSRGDGRLEVLREPEVPVEPGEQAFDHPAPRMHGEADLLGMLAHDLDGDRGRVRDAVAAVGAVSESEFNEREGLWWLSAEAPRHLSPGLRRREPAAPAGVRRCRPWRAAFAP